MTRISKRWFAAILASLLIAGAMNAQGSKQSGLNVPVTYYKLPNGLKVVLSPETSAPLNAYGVLARCRPRP